MGPWMIFMSGATATLYVTAALLFMRFHQRTRDRLFLFFAAAFAILGINRVFFLVFNVADEERTMLYAVRLCAFILIIIAIIDKNRHRPRKAPEWPAPSTTTNGG